MRVYLFTEPYIIDTCEEKDCLPYCLRREIGANPKNWNLVLIFSKKRFELCK